MGTGINVEKLQKICLDFTNYHEQVKTIFNNLDLEMVNVNSNLSSQCKQSIARLYSSIKSSCSIIEVNIPTFIDDFRKVISSREDLDIEISERIVADIAKLDERRD